LPERATAPLGIGKLTVDVAAATAVGYLL
jgi:hypothetical protein